MILDVGTDAVAPEGNSGAPIFNMADVDLVFMLSIEKGAGDYLHPQPQCNHTYAVACVAAGTGRNFSMSATIVLPCLRCESSTITGLPFISDSALKASSSSSVSCRPVQERKSVWNSRTPRP